MENYSVVPIESSPSVAEMEMRMKKEAKTLSVLVPIVVAGLCSGSVAAAGWIARNPELISNFMSRLEN